MEARILLFALDELRKRYGDQATAGDDPRSGTAPFCAWRKALLAAAAAAADRPATLTMWWEGTFNGYCLAVACQPPEALDRLDLEGVCRLEGERVAPPRPGGYPLARVGPGRAEVVRDREGAAFEAPFGAPAGHFGAPGVRRVS
jgi:hypothetical protein